MVRGRRRTSMNRRVAAVSPSILRAAARNASWAKVNTPDYRVCISAVEPGRPRGLHSRIAR